MLRRSQREEPMTTKTMEFEIGSTVALRSGGPGLTVLGQSGDRVHCVFFSDEIGEFRETTLPAVALEAASMGDDEDEDASEEAEETSADEDEDEDDQDENKAKAA
jgi:uncharacterized protein YodC (DUF2158 family)